MQLCGLTVPLRMYSHKGSFHFFFSILLFDGKRSIDQESVESYPAKYHHTFEPISAEEWCILAHIQHQRCVGSIYNEMVDHSCNRIHGIQMNLMMLLDPTTAYPSYGMEVQEVQAR